jgi:uncharacterized HAD superfamily protein/adenine/guanine phosphoribosyltransferase-like PRPP-binding protein
MNYRTLNDLSFLVNRCANKLPRDIDLVVGVTRSGMLAASMIALKLNLPLTDLRSFERNDDIDLNETIPQSPNALHKPQAARKVLLVDDTMDTGSTMTAAMQRIGRAFTGDMVTLAAFVVPEAEGRVDVFLEKLPQPRLFEWNIMHHEIIGHACLDIDGVLCEDPTEEENDDGERYIKFLQTAAPLHIPTTHAAHLVTSRLEKYRKETEEWLERHGVRYGQLHMLDLPSAAERRRLNAHHKRKAEVFKNDPEALLFIESEKRQALAILEYAQKPVFCIETNQLYVPGMPAAALDRRREAPRTGFGIKRRLTEGTRKLLGRSMLLPRGA